MSYSYAAQRPYVFTEAGQERLLRIRDRAQRHVERSGAVCYYAVTEGESGDSWDILACVDRLVELGYLRRHAVGATQDDVFTSPRWEYRRGAP